MVWSLVYHPMVHDLAGCTRNEGKLSRVLPRVLEYGVLTSYTLLQALTLEELDQVFSVSTRRHASYQLKNAWWHFQVWVLRKKLEPLPPFYRHADKLNEA